MHHFYELGLILGLILRIIINLIHFSSYHNGAHKSEEENFKTWQYNKMHVKK